MTRQSDVHSPSTVTLDVLDAIARRRSVRAYAPVPVERRTLDALLEAAVRAPTAMHREPWGFVIVEDRARLRRLSDRAKERLRSEIHRDHREPERHAPAFFESPGFDLFYDAPALVVICGEGTGPFVAADCWLAAANLMLAAEAHGLGTCVIGSALAALAEPDVKAELGIPPDFHAVAPIVVGTPAAGGTPTARHAPRVLARR